jgi:hypothetical protein
VNLCISAAWHGVGVPDDIPFSGLMRTMSSRPGSFVLASSQVILAEGVAAPGEPPVESAGRVRLIRDRRTA